VVAADMPSSEAGRNLARNGREFCLQVYLFIPSGILTYRKILGHGADGFTSPTKEVVLRIFITLKNSPSYPGFEPVNVGSNYKHDNHYTTENDNFSLVHSQRNCQQNKF
jgi:hypothetical protein